VVIHTGANVYILAAYLMPLSKLLYWYEEFMIRPVRPSVYSGVYCTSQVTDVDLSQARMLVPSPKCSHRTSTWLTFWSGETSSVHDAWVGVDSERYTRPGGLYIAYHYRLNRWEACNLC
jgi:hypothetical protein